MKKGFRKKISSVVLIAAMALSTVACGNTASQASVTSDSESQAEITADATSTTSQVDTKSTDAASDKIVMVWYPNESASDYESARKEFASLITKATGKEVEQKLTTDYSIAIEAVASGTAQICFMGAQGYIEAKNKNDAVQPLFVNSGESGTLDDAIYYSWLAVNQGDETEYADGDSYSIANIQGKRMSFVSDSSTSGFKIPTSSIITYFGTDDKWKDLDTDGLIEGDENSFFSEVLFGGSHQGSAVNLLMDKADLAAFCNTELAPYASCVSGEENKIGAVYEVNADASAPFDTLAGKQFAIINSVPVLNGPFAYNADTLSTDDVQKIQELFTSEEVSSNPQIFVTEESGNVGMFEKTDKEQIVLVDDSWYNPIRELSN